MRALRLSLLWLCSCSPMPLPDGSSCVGNDACASALCDLRGGAGRNGVCLGRLCDDASTCDEGYRCNTVSGTLGMGSSSRCVATCGHCPPYYVCPAGGIDGETLCKAAD